MEGNVSCDAGRVVFRLSQFDCCCLLSRCSTVILHQFDDLRVVFGSCASFPLCCMDPTQCHRCVTVVDLLSPLPQSWLKGASWFGGSNREQWEVAIARGRDAWAGVKAKYLTDPPGDVVLDPRLVKIIDESYARASWAELQRFLHDPANPWTLCHGDFHASNMFLRGGADREKDAAGCVETFPDDVTLFDWSEVGPWENTVDLAQTIISDVRAEVFKEHSRDVVRAYWERLTRTGSAVSRNDYPFEKCWASFCRSGPERWIWVFSMLASFPGIPSAAVQYFHNQLLEFILAHDPQPYYQLKSVVCLG